MDRRAGHPGGAHRRRVPGAVGDDHLQHAGAGADELVVVVTMRRDLVAGREVAGRSTSTRARWPPSCRTSSWNAGTPMPPPRASCWPSRCRPRSCSRCSGRWAIGGGCGGWSRRARPAGQPACRWRSRAAAPWRRHHGRGRRAGRLLPRRRVRHGHRRPPRAPVAAHDDPALGLPGGGPGGRRHAAGPRPGRVRARRAGVARALRAVLAARQPRAGLPAAARRHRRRRHAGARPLGRRAGHAGHRRPGRHPRPRPCPAPAGRAARARLPRPARPDGPARRVRWSRWRPPPRRRAAGAVRRTGSRARRCRPGAPGPARR